MAYPLERARPHTGARGVWVICPILSAVWTVLPRAGVLGEVLNISALALPHHDAHLFNKQSIYVSPMGRLLHISTADTAQPCRWRRRGRTLRVSVHSFESHETGFVTALPNVDYLRRALRPAALSRRPSLPPTSGQSMSLWRSVTWWPPGRLQPASSPATDTNPTTCFGKFDIGLKHQCRTIGPG